MALFLRAASGMCCWKRVSRVRWMVTGFATGGMGTVLRNARQAVHGVQLGELFAGRQLLEGAS